MATINIANADDRAYVREHIETQRALAKANQELANLKARVAQKTTIRDAVAVRALAGLTRQNPAAATALGEIYNLTVIDHLTDAPPVDAMELLSDADADAAQGI